MEDEQQDVAGQRGRGIWKLWLWVVGVMLALVVVVVLCLLFVGDVDVPRGVVTATRGADGKMVSDEKGKGHVGFEWTKLEANCDMSSAGVGSRGEGSKLFTRSIAVIAEGDSVLDRRVAYQLFKELLAGKRFERVVFYPAGSKPAEGEALPDLTARVRVWKLETKGLFKKEIHADVAVLVEANGAMAQSYYVDPLTPPSAGMNYAYALKCRANQKGIESAGMQYEAVGRNIAGTVATNIEATLAAMPNEPVVEVIAPEFMPKYTATPDFGFLKAFDARPLLSGPVFMKSNLSTWEVEKVPAGRDLVTEAEKELRDKGWVIRVSEGSGISRRLRATRNDESEVLEIQRTRMNEVRFGRMPLESTYAVCYERRMSETEIRAGLKAWLARNPSEEELLFFKKFWHFEQKLFEAQFRKSMPQTEKGLLHLARSEIGRKNMEEARKLVLRADAVGRIASPGGGTPSEVASVGDLAGLKTFPEYPDLTTLMPGEVVDVAQDLMGQQTAKRTVNLGQSVFVLWKRSDGDLRIQRVTPVRTGKPPYRYTFEIMNVAFEKNSSSFNGDRDGDATGQMGPIRLMFLGKRGSEEKGLILTPQKVGEAFELEFKAE